MCSCDPDLCNEPDLPLPLGVNYPSVSECHRKVDNQISPTMESGVKVEPDDVYEFEKIKKVDWIKSEIEEDCGIVDAMKWDQDSSDGDEEEELGVKDLEEKPTVKDEYQELPSESAKEIESDIDLKLQEAWKVSLALKSLASITPVATVDPSFGENIKDPVEQVVIRKKYSQYGKSSSTQDVVVRSSLDMEGKAKSRREHHRVAKAPSQEQLEKEFSLTGDLRSKIRANMARKRELSENTREEAGEKFERRGCDWSPWRGEVRRPWKESSRDRRSAGSRSSRERESTGWDRKSTGREKKYGTISTGRVRSGDRKLTGCQSSKDRKSTKGEGSLGGLQKMKGWKGPERNTEATRGHLGMEWRQGEQITGGQYQPFRNREWACQDHREVRRRERVSRQDSVTTSCSGSSVLSPVPSVIATPPQQGLPPLQTPHGLLVQHPKYPHLFVLAAKHGEQSYP